MARPSKFNESLEMVAINLAEQGYIDAQIVKVIDVSESALNEHKKRNPQFRERLHQAKRQHDNQLIESALLRRANGMTIKEVKIQLDADGKEVGRVIQEKEIPPDPQSLALFLKNRMSEEYNKERTQIDLSPKIQSGLSREEAIEILRNDPFA